MNNRNLKYLLQAFVMQLLCFAASGLASEIKITNNDVPAAVLDSFHKTYPSAKATGFAKEVENGKICFEIESRDGKILRDLLYYPDGSLVEIEEHIAASDLPKSVTEAIRKAFPQGKVVHAEKTTMGGVVKYELDVVENATTTEVVVSASGTIELKEVVKKKG